MKAEKIELIRFEFSMEEALKMLKELGDLDGITDDMVVMELIERLDMLT